ncbi:MAG: leucine-rich repeat domain-containing protein [Aureispira sp.]
MKETPDYYGIPPYGDGRPLGQYSYEELLDLTSLPKEKMPKFYQTMRRLAAEKLLQHHSQPTLEERPLMAGAIFCMVGTSLFKAKALKERLTNLGIQYATKVTAETTHVLLGNAPKKTRGLDEHKVTLLTDQDLQAALDRLEQPYLQEEAMVKGDTLNHLSDLLMSLEGDNVLLAIELMKGGGFPIELIPQAFWAMKSTSNKTIYKELKLILDKYLSPAGKKAIRRTLVINTTTTEVKLTKKLHNFCQDVPDLDALEIAQQLYKYHRKGMQYIWRYSKDITLHRSVIEGCIEGTVLNLKNKGLSILPKELSEFKQLETVILHGNEFRTMPRILQKLPALSHLDLSNNYELCQLSPRLLEMPALRTLNLHGWLDYWNIPTIKELTQLEKLILRQQMDNKGTDGIQKALPNCKVIYLP